MKILKKILLACALAGSLGWAACSLAADKLPDSNLGGVALATPQARLDKDKVCTRCHDESEPTPLLSLYQTKHGVRADAHAPNCQSCHGESEKHLHGDPNVKGRAAPDRIFKNGTYKATPVAVRNEACLTCHQKDSNRSHWEGSTHQERDVACNSCHQIHSPTDKVRDKRTQPEVCFTCHKEQRAQISRPSHHPIPEGKMACSDCHNPHGSAGPKLMKRDSVNNTCYTCHMEKRGPFVHNHEPVSEDCANCHNPHGTTTENMLKARAPFLCYQCHTPHGGNFPQLLGAQAVPNNANFSGKSTTNLFQGRGCLNCHTQVHGSNNPSAVQTAPQPQFMLR